jgi:hypothetical protein
MPVYEYECAAGHRTAELVGMTSDGRTPGGSCFCGLSRQRVVSRAIGRIPPWMTDENIAANGRHREWLKTPKAKAMDLERVSEDPEGGTSD